jgi:hypothetical protein
VKKALALLLVAAVTPLPALAQQAREAGQVSHSEGQVTAQGPGTRPSPALKLRDPVYLRDTITTGPESLVKMLMGGKAVVTVRELSSLTITEEPNRTLINMAANPPNGGKVLVNLKKDRMRPGESIDVRTPNAIASIRGSQAVVEHGPNVTDVDNVDGTDVRAAVIVANVISAFLQIPAGQGITITNILGPLRPVRPNVMQKVIAKGKSGRGQKPANPNVGADVSALGGELGSELPGAGGPTGYSTRILPGNPQKGYISVP